MLLIAYHVSVQCICWPHMYSLHDLGLALNNLIAWGFLKRWMAMLLGLAQVYVRPLVQLSQERQSLKCFVLFYYFWSVSPSLYIWKKYSYQGILNYHDKCQFTKFIIYTSSNNLLSYQIQSGKICYGSNKNLQGCRI